MTMVEPFPSGLYFFCPGSERMAVTQLSLSTNAFPPSSSSNVLGWLLVCDTLCSLVVCAGWL